MCTCTASVYRASMRPCSRCWPRRDGVCRSAVCDADHAVIRSARRYRPVQHRAADFDELEAAGFSPAETLEMVGAVDLFQAVNSYTDLMRVPVDAL